MADKFLSSPRISKPPMDVFDDLRYSICRHQNILQLKTNFKTNIDASNKFVGSIDYFQRYYAIYFVFAMF